MSGKLPYIGGGISLISKVGIRYEGILHTINSEDATITLAKVRSFGTENHSTPVRDESYEHVIFKASDIKDLVVCELSQLNQEQQSYVNDNNREPVLQSSNSSISNAIMQQPIPYADAKYAYCHHDASQVNSYRQGSKYDSGSGNGFRRTQGFHNHDINGFRRNNFNPFYSRFSNELLKFDSDYDFEKANEQFRNTMDTLGFDMSNFNLKENSNTVVTDTIESEEKVCCEVDTEEILDDTNDSSKSDRCYDKKTSFFDSISCDTHEKTEGKNLRPDWKKERLTNQETFGHFAVRSLEYRRGRNGYRLIRNRFARPHFRNDGETLTGSGGGFGRMRFCYNNNNSNTMTNVSSGTGGRHFPPSGRMRSTSRIHRKSLRAENTTKN